MSTYWQHKTFWQHTGNYPGSFKSALYRSYCELFFRVYDLFLKRFFDLIILNHCHNLIGEKIQTLVWWHMLDFSSYLVHLNPIPPKLTKLALIFDFSKPNQQPMYSIEPSPCPLQWLACTTTHHANFTIKLKLLNLCRRSIRGIYLVFAAIPPSNSCHLVRICVFALTLYAKVNQTLSFFLF